jgi:hypothetical protein
MRTRLLACLTVFVLAATPGVWGQAASTPPRPAPQTTFRGAVNLILVDVDVRDKSGQAVKGLTQSDFEILEDGKPQNIVTFAYEEITSKAGAIQSASMLANAGKAKGAVTVTVAAQGGGFAGVSDGENR